MRLDFHTEWKLKDNLSVEQKQDFNRSWNRIKVLVVWSEDNLHQTKKLIQEIEDSGVLK